MRKIIIIIVIGTAMLCGGVSAQQKQDMPLLAEMEKPLKYGADRLGKRQDADMKRFRDHRLGAFIHWGLYAIPGGEWNGKVYNGAAEWLKSWAKVPSDEWLGLMKQWNPTKFDAKAWARMAKLMGGNMVVNFGPQPDGDLREEEKQLAEEVGRWMARYGEAVYGCDYAGWEKQSWGYYTRKGDDVYMAVFNLPYSRHLTVKTPKGTKVTGATLVGGKDTAVR